MNTLLVFLLLVSSSLLGKDIAIIAHRGNSSEAPENTFAAFLSAEKTNADFIECDVHLNKEQIPIVIHDRYLCRTINSPYPIAVEEISLNQLESFDAGSWYSEQFKGQKIPILSTVLNTKFGQTGLFIEVKTGSAPNEIIAQKIIETINKSPSKTVLIGSMSPEILREVRKISPRQPIIAIINSISTLKPHRKNRPNFYAVESSLISSELVRVIHDEGRLIWAWTVNDPDDARALIAMNIDGIITDQPRKMHHIRISSLTTTFYNDENR